MKSSDTKQKLLQHAKFRKLTDCLHGLLDCLSDFQAYYHPRSEGGTVLVVCFCYFVGLFV